MTESPFMTTSQILADTPNGFDELRIIAQDERRLTKQDRDTLVRCADEMERNQRQLILTLSQLIEVNGRYIAVNDRLIELQRNTYPKITAQITARM